MNERSSFDTLCIDRSSPVGFQFEFLCPRCSTGYLSRFTALPALGADAGGFAAGKVAEHIPFVGHAIGDLASDMVIDRTKEQARQQAIAEVMHAFLQCPQCGLWRCRAHCWNMAAGVCLSCAPAYTTQRPSLGTQPSRQEPATLPYASNPAHSAYPAQQYTSAGYPAPPGTTPDAPYGDGSKYPRPPSKTKPSLPARLGLGCLAGLLVVILCVGTGLVYEHFNETGLGSQPTPTPSTQTPDLPIPPTLFLSCSGDPVGTLLPTLFLLINTDANYPITWSAISAKLDTAYIVWGTISPSAGTIAADGSAQVILTFMSSICQFVQQQGGSLDYSIGITYSTALGNPATLDQDIDITLR